jgi:hypothetical protein
VVVHGCDHVWLPVAHVVGICLPQSS